MAPLTEATEVAAIRSEIERFLAERLELKLDKAKDAEKRDALSHAHEREVWLADAARRVGQIQMVTHAIKYIHPEARGSSLHVAESDPDEGLVSSAGEQLPADVVGNAAALDVFKFLKLETEGVTILSRIQAGEMAVAAALSDDVKLALQWCEAFAGITDSDAKPASHTLAKQLYFPLADGGYHLLAPLYPTALAHRVYKAVDSDRFSEQTKTGRVARRAGTVHEGYREHPDLAARNFGGSKPQNISQLNSERRGDGYLLASLPPIWTSQGLRPPAHLTTLFGRWLLRNGGLWNLVRKLEKFLAVTQHNNLPIRQARGRMVNQIVDEVLYLAATIQQAPPGWSADVDCRLAADECYWLDPGRGDSDEQFAAGYATGDWAETVARKFGRWLNGQIRSDRAPLDKEAAQQWQEDFAKVMAQFQQEVGDDD